MKNKLNELFKELAVKIASSKITRDQAKAEMIKAGANRDDAEEIFGDGPEEEWIVR